MRNVEKKILTAMLVISIICLLTSILIEYQEVTKTQVVTDICKTNINGQNSCTSVQESKYGSVAGIPVAILGIIAFTVFTTILTLGLIQDKVWQRLLILIGAITAGISGIIFISIQAFILNTYCTYCLVIDSLSIVLLILALVLIKLEKKPLGF